MMFAMPRLRAASYVYIVVPVGFTARICRHVYCRDIRDCFMLFFDARVVYALSVNARYAAPRERAAFAARAFAATEHYDSRRRFASTG